MTSQESGGEDSEGDEICELHVLVTQRLFVQGLELGSGVAE